MGASGIATLDFTPPVGAEQVVNGTFPTDVANWELSTIAVGASFTQVGGRGRFEFTGGGGGLNAWQWIRVVAGRPQTIAFDIANRTGTPTFSVQVLYSASTGNPTVRAFLQNVTGDGSFVGTFVPATNLVMILLQFGSTAGQRIDIDNISLKDDGGPGSYEASVAVTGQAGIASGDELEAWLMGSTADHSEDEHALETIDVSAGAIIAGTGFTIRGSYNPPVADTGGGRHRQPEREGGGITGQWKVGWAWR